MKKILAAIFVLTSMSINAQVSHAAFILTQVEDSAYVVDWLDTDPEFNYHKMVRYNAPDSIILFSPQIRFNSFDSLNRSGAPRSQVWLDRHGNIRVSALGTNGQIQKSTGSSLAWFTPTYISGSDTISLSNRIAAKLNISDTTGLWQPKGNYYPLSGNPSGFLTFEVDGSTTNEIELPNQTGNAGKDLQTNGVTVSWVAKKKQETFSGTTNGSGVYTVTFGTAYSVAPNIQANIIGGTNTNLIKITSISTTGFSVTVVNRTDVVGLLPSYTGVIGAVVDVLITEK